MKDLQKKSYKGKNNFFNNIVQNAENNSTQVELETCLEPLSNLSNSKQYGVRLESKTEKG